MNHRLATLSLGLSLTACGGVIAADGASGEPQANPATPTAAAGPWAPSAACTPVGPVVKRIADLGDASPAVLVPNGPELWFTATTRGDASPASSSVGLYRVATTGGTPVIEPSVGRIGAAFAVSGAKLAVVRVTDVAPSSWLESLVVRDRNTGAEIAVTVPSKQRLGALRTTPSGLFYATQDPNTVAGSIAYFDGTRAKPVSSLRSPLTFVTDGREVFYVRYATNTAHRVLESASLQDGSSPRIVKDFGASVNDGHRVIGVDDNEVFVARTSPIGHGTFNDGDVLAIRRDGSGERVVVTIPGFVGDAIVDPDYVTWTDGISARAIVRARLTGGPTERIEAAGYVRPLATDACNLYWATSEPNAIYARSRLP